MSEILRLDIRTERERERERFVSIEPGEALNFFVFKEYIDCIDERVREPVLTFFVHVVELVPDHVGQVVRLLKVNNGR